MSKNIIFIVYTSNIQKPCQSLLKNIFIFKNIILDLDVSTRIVSLSSSSSGATTPALFIDN